MLRLLLLYFYKSIFTVFTIVTTGTVFIARQLDIERIASYTLTIEAKDRGEPPQSNTTKLYIDLIDVNDNKPRFLSLSVSAKC